MIGYFEDPEEAKALVYKIAELERRASVRADSCRRDVRLLQAGGKRQRGEAEQEIA